MRRLGLVFSGMMVFVVAGCGGDSFGSSPGSDAGADVQADAVTEQPVGDVSGDTASDTGPDAAPDAPEDVTTVGLVIAPESYSFSAEMGASSTPVVFTVTNAGTTTTGQISATSDSPVFEVDSTACSTLAPSASCDVRVVFVPDDEGMVSSTLRVEASPGGVAAASLVGITGAVSNGLEFSPPAYDFGPVGYGVTRFGSLNVKNIGSGAVQDIGFTVAVVGGAQVFSIDSHTCPSTLPAGDTCTVNVQYKPVESEPGKKTAEIRATAGTAEATAVVSGHTPDVFVRTNGNDSSDGLSAPTAFRTIGRGLSVADSGWNVRVLPGLYTGEDFPLVVDGVRLLGAGSGTESGSTKIAFEADSQEAIQLRGVSPAIEAVRVIAVLNASADATVLLGQPVDHAQVTNVVMELGTGWTGFGTNAPSLATFDVNGLHVLCGNATGNAIGIAAYGRADLSLRNSELNACKTGMTVDGNAKVTVRDTHFIEIGGDAVSLSSELASLDLGTADPAAPGNNLFASGANTFVALHVTALGIVDASGNTWLPNVQGADAQGHYAVGSVRTGPILASGGGANFVLATGSSVKL